MEHIGVLPTTQFAYQKGLGSGDALLCVSHTLQSAFSGRFKFPDSVILFAEIFKETHSIPQFVRSHSQSALQTLLLLHY